MSAVTTHVLGSIQRDLDFLKAQQVISPQQYNDILRILPTKASLANRNINSSPMSAPSPLTHTPPPPPTYTTATSNTEFVEALYDFNGANPEDLSFRQGDVIEIKEKVNADWWRGVLNGRSGLFPSNYVKPLPTSAPKEKQSPHYPPPPSSTNTNYPPPSGNTSYPPPPSSDSTHYPPPSASSPYNNNTSYPPPPSASSPYNNNNNNNNTSYPPPPSNYGNNPSYPPPPAANNASYNYPPPPQQHQETHQEAPSSHGESGFSSKAGGMFKNVATKVGDAATMGFGATLGSQAAHSLF
ncbi:unnamed protein product [Cunninghamella blakesleeana]